MIERTWLRNIKQFEYKAIRKRILKHQRLILANEEDTKIFIFSVMFTKNCRVSYSQKFIIEIVQFPHMTLRKPDGLIVLDIDANDMQVTNVALAANKVKEVAWWMNQFCVFFGAHWKLKRKLSYLPVQYPMQSLCNGLPSLVFTPGGKARIVYVSPSENTRQRKNTGVRENSKDRSP